jgi:membrane protein
MATAPVPNPTLPRPSLRQRMHAFFASALGRRLRETARYLMHTEVHTYAFSVAACAILSFVPFVVLLLWMSLRVFHSVPMYHAILQLVQDQLPSNQEFITRSLRALAAGHKRVQIFSMVMLLISSTGIFLPLEVALNRVWGFARNRSYWWNQVVSLGLAFAAGVLGMASVWLTAANRNMLERWLGSDEGLGFRILAYAVMKIAALAASIAIFFLIYWLLPNGKVKARTVAPAAVLTGLCWELAKYAYMLALPWLDLQNVYGPFATAVTLLIWAFLSGLLLLGGAHLSAGAIHSEDAEAVHSARSKNP